MKRDDRKAQLRKSAKPNSSAPHPEPHLNQIPSEEKIKSPLQDASNQSPFPEAQPTESLRKLRRLIQRAVKMLVVIVPLVWGTYILLPSWSLSLPSASYRPLNPYTAIFIFTNSGSLPATSVKVQCRVNDIRYTTQKLHSYGFVTEVGGLGDMYRNDARTFTCPQTLFSLEVIPGVQTPEQIRKHYEDDKKFMGPNGEWLGPDMSFDLADFSFNIIYSPVFLPFKWTSRYRVVGKPGQNGTFVWEQVDIHKKF